MKEELNGKKQLLALKQKIRNTTVLLCQTLENEDYVIQSSDDVSPIKWHLAHTTWFFEMFILSKYLKDYKVFNAQFQNLFNSYYQSMNEPFPKRKRGFLSRPTVREVYEYRKQVDDHLDYLLEQGQKETKDWDKIKFLIILGLQHEQQHQELMLMDIKYNFSMDPSFPVYRMQPNSNRSVFESSNNHPFTSKSSSEFSYVSGGIVNIGTDEALFAFDNECPRHQEILNPYLIANRLVTNGEYLNFIENGGYTNPQWWLSEGREAVLKNGWNAPLYWHKLDNDWHVFTLSGLRKLNLLEPVSHVSYFEADAYARWRGYRLPKESEWENFVKVNNIPIEHGNFLENEFYHPQQASRVNDLQQLFGDLWEWTSSSYSPYPGFKTLEGVLGEYNGKFMSGQMVLRGGSCATPQSHIRATYRNYYQPDKRWQFSGIRLAKEGQE